MERNRDNSLMNRKIMSGAFFYSFTISAIIYLVTSTENPMENAKECASNIHALLTRIYDQIKSSDCEFFLSFRYKETVI